MLLSWNGEAYLLYHAFAGTQPIKHFHSYLIADVDVAKGHILSEVARLSEGMRNTFISGVVAELRKLKPPKRIEGVSPFDPPRILCSLLRGRRYAFPAV
jgi:hypothetical protein